VADEERRIARQTRAPGDRARARIVELAARLASIEGLEGLSIGRLAEASGAAKSSIHALFGSKEELQLATINAARDSFIAEVVGPAFAATSPGRERLLALCEGYLSYVERRVFPGGCFFVAASAEVGGQPGRVHDEVARVQQQWRDLLLQQALAAADKGELTAADEPAQLAFELGVILAGTDIVAILHDDPGAVSRGRTAVVSRLMGTNVLSAVIQT
jgi:AcrR family transcriptional regulator